MDSILTFCVNGCFISIICMGYIIRMHIKFGAREFSRRDSFGGEGTMADMARIGYLSGTIVSGFVCISRLSKV